MGKQEFKSRVYTDRPPYADFDAPHKFEAIKSIVAKRLIEHPNAICSYSGGADSDILIDVIERTREIFSLPPVKYAFFNTGLEMMATKNHVRDTAQKYGVEIETFRPKVNIVMASRKYGIPFVSKIMSAVTTHNSCQNVHIIKNRPGKPGLPGFMPRYTGTAKRTTHVNATRKNAAFWGSTLHLGPMA